jgi:UDP-N-acetylmuramate dehydrogenase
MQTMSLSAVDCLNDQGCPYETDEPLGPRTWYGVGGRAALLAHPVDATQLAAIVSFGHQSDVPVRVLGKGANLLVATEKVDGIVLVLDATWFKRIEIDEASQRVTCGGGAHLEQTLTATVRAGLGGLEHLAGIPATIGGALQMNAGGAFGEIGPAVESVTLIELDGQLKTLEAEDLTFSYRHTNLGGRFVVDARFILQKVEDPAVLRDELKRVMKYKKDSQPMADDSAGCAFKNPKSQSDKGAGQLIDEAGLKGFRIGGAEISTVHANFIVLHPGAKATNVLALMNHVQREVQGKFSIDLEPEVVVWS